MERHWVELEQGGCVDCVKFKGIISFICGIGSGKPQQLLHLDT